MRNIIATLVICTAILCSCNSKKEHIASKYLNAGNLQEQLFTIDIHKDNNLVTQQGIQIKINANSIEASTPTVTLQVKEALTLDAMLKAGLTTQTSNGMLSSDGMFYLATKEQSTIKKPLEISVPTTAINPSMQLYKGKEDNGTIVWEDPKPLDAKPLEDSTGRVLFNRYCASCHFVGRKLIGSDLGWIENRWPNREHLRSFIKNPVLFANSLEADAKKLVPERNHENEYREDTAKENRVFQQIYAKCIACKNSYSMTSFEGVLKNEEIEEIINYTIKESKRLGLPVDHNPNKDCDTCVSTARKLLGYAKSRMPVVSTGGFSEDYGIEIPSTEADTDTVIPASAKHVEFNNKENYQFKLEAYGWYNVDCLLTGKFNSVETELSVEVTAPGLDKQSIFLVIPDVKVFVQGGKLENGKDYGFNTMDGKLILPQGYQAYILLVGEQNGKPYFGKTIFTTSLKGHVKVGAKETTKEKVTEEVANFKLDAPPQDAGSTQVNGAIRDSASIRTREEERKLEEKLMKCVCIPQKSEMAVEQ